MDGLFQWTRKCRVFLLVLLCLHFSTLFLIFKPRVVVTGEFERNLLVSEYPRILNEHIVRKPQKPLRVLVTGAAGFIGFHLSMKLKERNDYVVGIDNFNDYYSTQLKEDRSRLLKLKNITTIHGDVCDGELLEHLFQQHSFTHVVHLAAQAGVQYSKTNPQAYVRNNVECFVSLLEVLRNHLNVKLIYASSSSVYGANTKVPFSETDRTDSPISLYAATKKECELLAHAYQNLYGISSTGLRFFTVYGPWGRPDNAYFTFAKAIEYGKPIEVRTPENGVARRDFTYVDDIVDGVIAATELGADFEIFNLGTNKVVDLNNYIKVIEKAMGKPAILQKVKIPPGDVAATHSDVSHAHEYLNYNPKVPIEDGIPKFVKWFKSYYHLDCRILVTLEEPVNGESLVNWINNVKDTGLYVTLFHNSLPEEFTRKEKSDHLEFQRMSKPPLSSVVEYLKDHSELRFVLYLDGISKEIIEDPFRVLDGEDFTGLDKLIVGTPFTEVDSKVGTCTDDTINTGISPLYPSNILGGTQKRVLRILEQLERIPRDDSPCDASYLFNKVLAAEEVAKISQKRRILSGYLFQCLSGETQRKPNQNLRLHLTNE